MIPLTGIEKSFTITDFWRWWVVHLWVEQSFEFFAACHQRLSSDGDGIGFAHARRARGLFRDDPHIPRRRAGHRPSSLLGGRARHVGAAGSMFSFIEVLPLVLLSRSDPAITAHQGTRRIQIRSCLYLYIIGAAFWNFVGAGVFGGGTLNAPLVNYYEHGTFLTLAHAHTALFGAFGELGIGLIYFCLRYIAGEQAVRATQSACGPSGFITRLGSLDRP